MDLEEYEDYKLSKNLIIEIIQEFKNLPCLWNVSHVDYRNKSKRNRALDILVSKIRSEVPTATREDVKHKIQNLRTAYLRERKRMIRSRKNGDIMPHVPKLWYYPYMKFLDNIQATFSSSTVEPKRNDDAQGLEELVAGLNDDNIEIITIEPPRATTSSNFKLPKRNVKSNSLNEILTQVDNLFGSKNEDNTEKITEEPRKAASSSPFNFSLLKRKVESNSVDEVLTKVSKWMDEPFVAKSRPYDGFGEYVAQTLRSMTSDAQIHCTRIINEALHYGQLNRMSELSVLLVGDEDL